MLTLTLPPLINILTRVAALIGVGPLLLLPSNKLAKMPRNKDRALPEMKTPTTDFP